MNELRGKQGQWFRLRRLQFIVSVLVLSTVLPQVMPAKAQADGPVAPKNIVAIGVPPIPSSLPRDVQKYTSIYGLPLAGWNSTGREILLKGLSSVTWISRVSSPGSAPETYSIYIQSSGIYDIYFQPQRKYLAYTRDAAGNEAFQLYLYNIATRTSTMLSDGKSRNTEPVWSNTGDKLVYSSSPFGSEGVNLRLIEASGARTDRLLVKSTGSYLKAYEWSPDDKSIVYCDFKSNTTSTLWLVNVETGRTVMLSPTSSNLGLYDFPQFNKNSKGIYVLTDRDSDFRRIAYIDIATHKVNYVSPAIDWDVEEFQLSPDGQLIAFITNENGISFPYLVEISTGKKRKLEDLPVGVISDIKWRNDSTEFAFNLRSPMTPNDVYSINATTGAAERWAKSVDNGVNTTRFIRPELIHWKSFDNEEISGFLYRPAKKFEGKRPVIIDLHGGPEEQYRPSFVYDDTYLINELGIAKIYPNIRGSSGYGKNFLSLDNGPRRPDAVRDIGALLEWLQTEPGLDAGRVLVQGMSYGGFLALSTAFTYPNRIRGAISDSGISDLASFVEKTEGWRRELQRSEFGDERDPKAQEAMTRMSPLHNAERIKRPLLLIQGQNDPRVPASDTDRLVAAVKGRVPVWYILAKNEGHGFVQKENRDYRTYATILFVKEFLLK